VNPKDATAKGFGDPGAPSRAPRVVRWAWLGRVPYGEALALQERIREGVIAGTEQETLLLLEHPPIITLGRNADPANLLVSPRVLSARGIEVARVSRGGDVTYHGPGQLVGYPVLRLPDGIRAHVLAMGGAIVSLLAELGIVGHWRDTHPGVWLGDAKICALGVHVRRRVAIHGFALNVNIDLAGFSSIVPCGLRDSQVTSIAQVLGRAPAMDVVAERTASAIQRSLGLRLVPVARSRLHSASGS
jgi:lipoyl(octanoyl) transferase